jgi:hypothetical protein
LSTLDKKLAILKGFMGSPPLAGSLVLQHGVDVYSMFEGLVGVWEELRAQLAQSLNNAMQSELATSMGGLDQMPARIDLLERMLEDGGKVFVLLSNMTSPLWELEHVGLPDGLRYGCGGAVGSDLGA